MRQPQASTMPVTKIPINEDGDEAMFVILFDLTQGACFSLHQMLKHNERGGPIILADDSEQRLHSHLLSDAYVGPGAQLAYLVHEFGGVDHEPGGKVIINVLSYGGSLPNGCITIDIPRGQVAAGYIEFVAKETPKSGSRPARRDEDDDEDEEG